MKLWTHENRPHGRAMRRLLTHWGLVTHICVSNPTIIGPDNGLSPIRRQAIIGTNAGILLIRPLGTNFSEMWIEIHIFSFRKMHSKMVVWEMAAILSRPLCVKSPMENTDREITRVKCIPVTTGTSIQRCPLSFLQCDLSGIKMTLKAYNVIASRDSTAHGSTSSFRLQLSYTQICIVL